ncbi:MAG: hypothetical protein IJS58_03005 [Bacilli bacterium]|nr:hypothetical protein [Bacilli bacterium]
MEKIEEEVVQKTNYIHKYFCDGCGELLGTSVECDDGYVRDYKRYEVSFYLPLDCDHSGHGKGERFKLKKHYCDSCVKNISSKIQDTLVNLGFEIENYND